MVKQIDELLVKTRKFIAGKSESDLRASMETGLWANRIEAAVVRLSDKGAVYRDQLKRGSGYAHDRRFVHNMQVLLSLREDLAAGWTESVVELVHADTYSNFLQMAHGLLSKGYKDAAAVIVGTALEVHVRALCVKHSVPTAVAGKQKKADTMNADLKKAGAYDGLHQKEVTTWMALRNSAAHGAYDDYDHAQVRRFLDGIEAFMKKFPA
ncbi:hypothetical protein [Streptomyces sp. SGAir0957]